MRTPESRAPREEYLRRHLVLVLGVRWAVLFAGRSQDGPHSVRQVFFHRATSSAQGFKALRISDELLTTTCDTDMVLKSKVWGWATEVGKVREQPCCPQKWEGEYRLVNPTWGRVNGEVWFREGEYRLIHPIWGSVNGDVWWGKEPGNHSACAAFKYFPVTWGQ